MSAPGKQNNTAQNPHAQLFQLHKPEKLSEVLKQDKYNCLSCRLVGSAGFFGLAAYVFWSGSKALNERGSEMVKKGAIVGLRGRMAGLTLLTSSLAGLGLYRLVN